MTAIAPQLHDDAAVRNTSTDIVAYLSAELPKRPIIVGDDPEDLIAMLISDRFPHAAEHEVKAAVKSINALMADGVVRIGSALRPIEPIRLDGLDVGDPENLEPICMNVNPKTLFVDPLYQRSIGERGLRKIRQMIENWDWNRFSPPACAYASHNGQTVLKVFDGQHTSIAAASHPKIKEIPVMIHEAPETAQQASAFVGQNSGHLSVTPLQLHQAALIAGDEDALTVSQVCARAGVKILRSAPKQYQIGETVAVNAIQALIDKRSAMKARIILEVLAKAKFGPLTSPQIKAVELLLCDPEYAGEITPENLTAAISGNWVQDQDAAKQLVIMHKWKFWRALAIVWFRNTKKARKAT